MEGRVYKIYAIGDADCFYIGSTRQRLNQRFSYHKSDARRGKPSKLHEKMRELGLDAFDIEILEEREYSSPQEMRQVEQHYIDELAPPLNEINAFLNAEELRLQALASVRRYQASHQDKYKCICGYQTVNRTKMTRHLQSPRVLANGEHQPN